MNSLNKCANSVSNKINDANNQDCRGASGKKFRETEVGSETERTLNIHRKFLLNRATNSSR